MPSVPAGPIRLERRDPSAHVVLVRGDRHDILVDAGYGGAIAETERLLDERGAQVGLLALTHMHCDHAGGAGALQSRRAIPVALHRDEAALVHARDPDAGHAHWLTHPLAPFSVDRALTDGDVLDDHGGPTLVVVHLGAQTPGHVAFHLPDHGLLLTGDLLQERDVAWLPPGEPALREALVALYRMEATGARTAYPGHGPPLPDVPAAIERARARYTAWLDAPEQAAVHALKRLVVATLQIDHGALPRLSQIPALRAYAAATGVSAATLLEPVLAGLRRSGIISDGPGGTVPAMPHDPPGAHPYGPLSPTEWPADLRAAAGEFPFP